ncbi:MAG: ABC-2 type transport system permease protein [Paraglaciecola sp.]|jgi:ABC-2 type transport system permease protein
MSKISILFRREFSSFFATPVAYVFIGIFLILSSVFTFFAVVFMNEVKPIYYYF